MVYNDRFIHLYDHDTSIPKDILNLAEVNTSNEPGAKKTVDYVLCWMRPRRILVGFLITSPNSSCDANEIFED